MNEREITCYLFDRVPGAHHSWTLAVFAVDEKDAKNYIKRNHPGAHCCGPFYGQKVNADCGATTEKARVLYAESYR